MILPSKQHSLLSCERSFWFLHLDAPVSTGGPRTRLVPTPLPKVGDRGTHRTELGVLRHSAKVVYAHTHVAIPR